MSATALRHDLHTLTYTPAVCTHLEDLRQSYVEQIAQARARLEQCEAVKDSDGVKCAQVDMTAASKALLSVLDHLTLANREWTH